VFEKIMLTLDGSELAEVAIPYARVLAERFGADVVVLEVIPRLEGPAGYSIEGAHVADERDAQSHLAAAAEVLRPAARSVEIVMVEGHAGDQIVEQAVALGCDAIVMATHGRSGLGRALLGSVAEHVACHSRGTAVVLVRPNGVGS
jgi:nucleotide-binding universal stress UspA family protein